MPDIELSQPDDADPGAPFGFWGYVTVILRGVTTVLFGFGMAWLLWDACFPLAILFLIGAAGQVLIGLVLGLAIVLGYLSGRLPRRGS